MERRPQRGSSRAADLGGGSAEEGEGIPVETSRGADTGGEAHRKYKGRCQACESCKRSDTLSVTRVQEMQSPGLHGVWWELLCSLLQQASRAKPRHQTRGSGGQRAVPILP